MNYSISQNIYHRLRILHEQSQPTIGFAEVTKCLIQSFILTKLVWTRNFFERLKKSGGATREVSARAKNNLGRSSYRSIRKEASRLMGQKLGQINREIRAQQFKTVNLSNKVEQAFGQNKGRFIELKRQEESRVWEAEKHLKLQKL